MLQQTHRKYLLELCAMSSVVLAFQIENFQQKQKHTWNFFLCQMMMIYRKCAPSDSIKNIMPWDPIGDVSPVIPLKMCTIWSIENPSPVIHEYRCLMGCEGGVCGVMVIVVGNGHGDTILNPNCISHSTNILGKGMNPIILPPAIGK